MVDALEVGMKLHAKYYGEFYPAEVVAVSTSKKRSKAPVKIHYKGEDESEDTWLSLADLKSKRLPKDASTPPAKAKAKPSAYKKVQCVAYEISTRPTGMDTDTTADDFYKGLWGEGNGPCWEDMNQRVCLFGEALAAAAASDDIDKSPETLKVFMAPEFLLRGPRGAYKLDALLGTDSKPGMLAKLSALVKGDEWKHWFVIFGTVIGYTEDPSNGSFPCYNCACAQLGGWHTEKERSQGAIAILKKFKSTIDFLKNPANIHAVGDEEVHHMSSDEAETLVGFNKLDGDGVFEIGGVTIGVEICLDHAKARLKHTVMKPGNIPQLQIVPSCGMSIMFDSIVVPKGGICFGVDGLDDGYDGQPKIGAFTNSQLYVVPSEAGARYKQMLSIQTQRPDERVPSRNTQLKQSYLEEKQKITRVPAHKDWKTKLGKLYDVSGNVEPMISVYGSLPLPPKMAVVQRGKK
jgi:hypothetical protein